MSATILSQAAIESLVAKRKQKLLEEAIKQGFITDKEIRAVFPKGDEYLNQIDEFANQIWEQGIRIVPAEIALPVIETITQRTDSGKLVFSQQRGTEEYIGAYELYLNEIRQYPILTFVQEKWLGIAIDCPSHTIDDKKFQNLGLTDNPFEKIFLMIYDLVCEKGDVIIKVLSVGGLDLSATRNYLELLVRDTLLFQDFKPKQTKSVLVDLLNLLPNSVHNYLYDLCVFLYAIPPRLLQMIQTGLHTTGKFPPKFEVEKFLKEQDGLSLETRAIRSRAKNAKTALILHNLRLVAYFASHYQNQGLDILDLCQEGNLGLIKAVDRFEYRQGNKFSTYAVWWIRQSITRGIADKSNIIRIPVHLHDAIQRVRKTRIKFIKETGRKPQNDELAQKCGLSVSELSKIIKNTRNSESLDEIICCEDRLLQFIDPEVEIVQVNPCPYRKYAECFYAYIDSKMDDDFELPPCLLHKTKEMLCADGKPDYTNMMFGMTLSSEPSLERIIDEEVKKVVNDTLDQLGPRQSLVIKRRYGFDDGQSHTLEEVGAALGVTRERIRQIEKAAFIRINHPVVRNKLSKLLRKNLAENDLS